MESIWIVVFSFFSTGHAQLFIATRKVVWKLDSLGSPRGVTIAPDGRTAFVTLADDPAVGVIDLVERKLVRKIGVGASPDGVAYGPSAP